MLQVFQVLQATDPDPAKQEENMVPLFETIIENIPAPVDNSDEPLQFQVALLDYNDYVGRIGVGRVFRGKMHVGQQVVINEARWNSKTIPCNENIWFISV